MDCGSTILIFLAFIQATCGQSVTMTGPSAIEQGSDTVYICTRGGTQPSTYLFRWTDVSVVPSIQMFNGEDKVYPADDPKYVNFEVSENGGTSTMTISNTQIEDEGQYRCDEGQLTGNIVELTVEVNYTRSLSVRSTIESNIDMYEATCEALEGRPEVTITWMLDDGPSPCDSLVVTPLPAGTNLSSTRSVCTFEATSENYNQTLKCVISGHQVSDLNGNKTITLDMHSEPIAGILMVRFEFLDPSLRVSCDIDVSNQPKPSTRNYYIYSNDTLIHQSSTGVNFVDVSEVNLYTKFTCVAGNYLDNTTSDPTRYDPTSTTTPTPTTTAALETTSKGGNETGSGGTGLSTTQQSTISTISTPDPPVDSTGDPSTSGLGPGAYAGIAIGVIACIVIIVVIVLYLLKPECCPCFAGSGTKSSGSSKPAGSAVGSSNGSERDVESPLNGVKDVTAEEKTKPEAAPRGHGSIQHTNDNPNQDMYAMVDKKPSGGRGGDAPDRGSGPGQNEPQGMLYADLDLSHKAGHTDKHVPKNENDVVVYSSILV